MPEGDNIKRVATVLQRELAGRTVTRLELHDLGAVTELAGTRVERVEPLGKHLLIHFESGWSLRVHLGMHGSWLRRHAQQPNPPLWTVVIRAGEIAFACVRSYRAELVKTAALRHHARLARLGPDLLADPPDIEQAVQRASLAAHANREIGELLLDQRIAAGIGNIYKSETLFECRIHPRTRLYQLTREQLRQIFETGARLMRLNLLARGRATVPLRRRAQPSSRRFFVYGRAGQPCLDCKTAVERFLQGEMARSTYFCPNCQKA